MFFEIGLSGLILDRGDFKTQPYRTGLEYIGLSGLTDRYYGLHLASKEPQIRKAIDYEEVDYSHIPIQILQIPKLELLPALAGGPIVLVYRIELDR